MVVSVRATWIGLTNVDTLVGVRLAHGAAKSDVVLRCGAGSEP